MPINRKTNFVDLQTCSGKFNCQYIRPGRNMNLQPVSGYISDNKYIQEMGSLLSKQRITASRIQTASIQRKNTVVFLSRGQKCGVLNNCRAPARCPQCTRNRNPNNNPI